MKARHPMARLAAAVAATLIICSVSVSAVAAQGSGLAAVRAATARFHSLGQAGAAGYALPPAGAPLHECISSFDNTGAMGYHYINGGLLDTTVDPNKPEALVYAPDSDGHLQLVALEYVVFQAPWIVEHGDTMPSLFGQMFMATGSPNRYDIPAFFSLHLWLWQANPAGLFTPFNPSVSCGGAAAARNAGAGAAGLLAQTARFDCAVPQRRVSQA
jgi:hypothetical protein